MKYFVQQTSEAGEGNKYSIDQAIGSVTSETTVFEKSKGAKSNLQITTSLSMLDIQSFSTYWDDVYSVTAFVSSNTTSLVKSSDA